MDHKTHKLCPLLWKHLCVNTTGSLKPCCEFPAQKGDSSVILDPNRKLEEEFNSDYFVSIRQAMLDGDSYEMCDKICYQKEKQGYTSKRLHEIQKYEKEVGQAFTGNETSVADINDIDYLDLKPSNFCNSKCVMCNNNRSSQFAVESKKFRNYEGPTIVGGWYEKNKHKIEPLYKDLRLFKLNGGETSVMPEFEEIVKGVAKAKSKRTLLILNINNTVDLTEYHEYLKDIHSISIVHSIEGYGKENEYIRFPANWDLVYENIKKMYEYSQENTNIITVFGMLVMSLNYKTFPFAIEKLHNEFPKAGYYIGHIRQPEPWLVNGLTEKELEEGLHNLETVIDRLPKKLNDKLKDTHLFYKEAVRKGSSRRIRRQMQEAIRHLAKIRNLNIKDYIDIEVEEF